jgi:hypothetical protein
MINLQELATKEDLKLDLKKLEQCRAKATWMYLQRLLIGRPKPDS